MEDNFLQPRQHNYLMSLYLEPGSARVALAWTDLSTGEIHTSVVTRTLAFSEFFGHLCHRLIAFLYDCLCSRFAADELPAELARVDPAEILVSETETSLLSNLAGNAVCCHRVAASFSFSSYAICFFARIRSLTASQRAQRRSMQLHKRAPRWRRRGARASRSCWTH